MLNNYCLVCSDVNSFNGKVFQLENVLKRLRIIRSSKKTARLAYSWAGFCLHK